MTSMSFAGLRRRLKSILLMDYTPPQFPIGGDLHFVKGLTPIKRFYTQHASLAFRVLDLMTDEETLAVAQQEFNQRADAAGRLEPLIPKGTLPLIDPDFVPAFVREHHSKMFEDKKLP